MKKISIIIITLILANILLARTITLEEAEVIAIKNNPTYQGKKAAVSSAKQELLNSYSALLPSASLTAGYSKNLPEIVLQSGNQEDTKRYGISATQTIFAGGRIFFNTRISKNSLNLSKLDLKSQKLQLLTDVKTKYFSVLENKNLLEITKKDFKNASENLEIAEFKYKNGSLAKADLLKLQSEQANKKVSLIQMRNYYKISKEDFKNSLNLDEEVDLAEIDYTKYAAEIAYFNNLVEKEDDYVNHLIELASNNNPTLQQFAFNIKTAKLATYLVAGSFLPNVSLNYSNNWIQTNLDDGYSDQGTLSLNFSLPIFPLVDKTTNYGSAKNDYRELQYNHESVKNSVKLGVKNTIYSLITAAQTVNSAQIAKDFAEETYLQMQERFKSGMISSTDLLGANLVLLNAQNRYISSKYNFLKIRSQLLQQLGMEDPKILINK